MIGTLLDFTRLRFHTFPVSLAPGDMGEIAHGAIEEVRISEPNRPIQLRARGSLRGQWDSARMSQVITNLVSNALAYGEPGTAVTVEVEGDERNVTVRVHNLGTPIPPAFMAVIFEPFRRAVPEDGSPHGLGLGLYIVQQIVLAHGGEIHVQSNAREGTAFTMRLPVAAAGAARVVDGVNR